MKSDKEAVVADRESLKVIEEFMGYAPGYLSEVIRWNDIMPVVEKIDAMGHDIDIFWHSSMRNGVEYRHAICAIQDRPSFKAITYQEGNPMISTVYNAIVEFIKFFNQQKQ